MKKPVNKKEQRRGASAKLAASAHKERFVRLRAVLLRLSVMSLALGSMVAVYWGGAQLLVVMDQPLKQVQIRGDFKQLDVDAIAQLVQKRVDQGLVALDLAEVQRFLLKQPWVEQVSVRRKWPNLLLVDLVERSPVARWNEDALLTAKAEVFRPIIDLDRFQLPRLAGNDDSRQEVLQQFGWLSEQLREEDLVISELRKEQRGAWQILLAQGVQVELGSGDLANKVERLKGLYQSALRERMDDIEKIDLRYTHGAAVQWKAGVEGRVKSKHGAQSSASEQSKGVGVFNGSSTA